MPSYLIGLMKDIESKNYLELGVHAGNHFNAIPCQSKMSVDIGWSPTHKMTTDQFFTVINPIYKWDVIYIDADHYWESVLKDFNNSIKRLNNNGVIFMHDMFPPTEELTEQRYCGDAYKVLDAMVKMRYPYIYVQDPLLGDYGVTMIFNPKEKIERSLIDPYLSYNQFRQNVGMLPVYSIEEQKQALTRHGW